MEAWLRQVHQSQVHFVGFPCSFGQGKAGVEKGPAVMRAHGIISQLQEMNVPARDLGDVEVVDYGETENVNNVRKCKSVGAANQKLSDAVKGVVQGGHMCVALGGDHCIGIGAVHGQSQASPGLKLIWVDAHADLNPPHASLTANAHGMPVCFLARELRGFIPENLPGFEWFKPCISVKDIVYIGLRDVDQAERKLLKEHQIKCFSALDVSMLGISEVLRQTLDYLKPSHEHPIHLSVDIDALDPIHSASTGTPVIGGLSLREGMSVVETVAATGFLQVISLAEVNPSLGTEDQRKSTLDCANEIIAAAFARRATLPYHEGK